MWVTHPRRWILSSLHRWGNWDPVTYLRLFGWISKRAGIFKPEKQISSIESNIRKYILKYELLIFEQCFLPTCQNKVSFSCAHFKSSWCCQHPLPPTMWPAMLYPNWGVDGLLLFLWLIQQISGMEMQLCKDGETFFLVI